MKTRLVMVLVIVFVLMITGCGKSNNTEELADMTTLTEDGYTAIVWDENIYVPYCAIQRSDCGKQIGFVDGDKDDKVYEYKGYSTVEWIINMYVSGLMDSAMLYREVNVTDIPNGLVSEYNWNNLPTGNDSEKFETDADAADENTLTFTGTIIDHVLESLAPVVCVKQLEDVIPYEAVFFELPDDKADWGLLIGAVVTITCADTFSEQVPYSGTLISIEDATIDNSATPFTEEQIEEAKGIAFGYFAGAASTVESIEFLEEKHYENGIDCCNFIVSLSRKGDVWPDRIISLQLDNGAWEIVNTFQRPETERKPWESVEPTAVNPDKLADRFGISLLLPENPNWIVNREYHLIDDNNLEITYYDPGIDSDCVILVAQNETLALPENEYDERLNESWEGWTINGQHIVVKVQRGKNDSQTVLATWEYNEYQFAIIGEIEGELDSGSIAKVALYIIENLN